MNIMANILCNWRASEFTITYFRSYLPISFSMYLHFTYLIHYEDFVELQSNFPIRFKDKICKIPKIRHISILIITWVKWVTIWWFLIEKSFISLRLSTCRCAILHQVLLLSSKRFWKTKYGKLFQNNITGK